jgi:hypothetical protein
MARPNTTQREQVLAGQRTSGVGQIVGVAHDFYPVSGLFVAVTGKIRVKVVFDLVAATPFPDHYNNCLVHLKIAGDAGAPRLLRFAI